MNAVAKNHRWPCPCCGYKTMKERPPGTHQICPVCNWEDDYSQFHDDTQSGGANWMSLKVARESFRRIGAVDESFLLLVRPPRPEEV